MSVHRAACLCGGWGGFRICMCVCGCAVQLINFGQKVITNNMHGYLPMRIVQFLSNIHTKPHSIYLSRHGQVQIALNPKPQSLDDRTRVLASPLRLVIEATLILCCIRIIDRADLRVAVGKRAILLIVYQAPRYSVVNKC